MDPPTSPHASGIPTNISHDPDNNLTVLCVILTSVCLLTVCLRFYARVRFSTVGPDDWAILPAMLCCIVHAALAIVADLHGGLGKRLWVITYDEYVISFKMALASTFMYPIMTTCCRISILLFYLRIFKKSQVKHALLVKIMMGLMIPYVVVYEFCTGFWCHPINTSWDPITRNTHCGDIYYYRYSLSLYSVSLVFDVMLLILPMRPIWSLQIPLRQKLSVVFILVLGTSACIAVATKIAYYTIEWKRVLIINPRWGNNPLRFYVPPQWDTYAYTYWTPSQCEPCAAIIGCSIPALKPLLVNGSGRIRSMITRSSGPDAGSRDSRSAPTMSWTSRRSKGFKRHDSSEQVTTVNQSRIQEDGDALQLSEIHAVTPK